VVVIEARLDSATVARIRLATSPAIEMISWLGLTARGNRHSWLGDPGAAARSALAHTDVALLATLLGPRPTPYVPDFLTPRPPAHRWADNLELQLQALRETSDADIEHELEVLASRSGPLPPAIQRAHDRGMLAPRVANGMRRFWQVAMADRWRTFGSALGADIDDRMRLMAEQGIGALLASLDDELSWDGEAVRVDRPFEVTTDYRNEDLVLVPSLLAGRLLVQLSSPADGFVVFRAPASRILDLDPSPDLAPALGSTRVVILHSLDEPATTTELSRRLKFAPSTVSHHLQSLVRAGLAHRRRDGPVVWYSRTERGHLLVTSR
jgi:DNA-binding transcriptional ArsR family regulator